MKAKLRLLDHNKTNYRKCEVTNAKTHHEFKMMLKETIKVTDLCKETIIMPQRCLGSFLLVAITARAIAFDMITNVATTYKNIEIP